MDPEEYSQEMISYVYGELSEEETANFEARLRIDFELAEELKALKKIIDAGKRDFMLNGIVEDSDLEQAALEAEEDIRDFDDSEQKENVPSKKFRRGIVLAFAASFAALLFFGNIIIYITSPSTAYLYYFQDYSPEYYAQAVIDETKLLQTQSKAAYQNGNYHLVAENMRTLMEHGELNARGRFTLGAYDASKELYETIWDKKINLQTIEQEEALWYLAMTSYKLNELRTAQIYCKEIIEIDGRRAKKAARLGRKISKMR